MCADYNMNKTAINVKDIGNIIHIGNIIPKNTKSKGKWKLDYVCDSETKNRDNGRIYFIVVNDEIYKIGCSECKGGIKNTFNFYESGLGGSPSIRTFGIHLLIQKELDNEKRVQIYCLFIEPIKIVINGIFSSSEVVTYPQIKTMEDLCRKDYKNTYGKYPKWNFQENVEEWPHDIKESYKQQVINR